MKLRSQTRARAAPIKLLLWAVLVLSAGPAGAAPLQFGVFNGSEKLSASRELIGCREDDAGTTCRLARTSFGGLPIEQSRVTLNTAGRVRSVEIVLDDGDHDTATQLLIGRYGSPGRASAWRGFDDGAAIAISRTDSYSLIAFRFPANDIRAAPAALDTGRMMPILLFLLLGIGAGLILLRLRSPGAPKPAYREPTMRETLERRLARGDDLGL